MVLDVSTVKVSRSLMGTLEEWGVLWDEIVRNCVGEEGEWCGNLEFVDRFPDSSRIGPADVGIG